VQPIEFGLQRFRGTHTQV